jgi:hypothetical protein
MAPIIDIDLQKSIHRFRVPLTADVWKALVNKTKPVSDGLVSQTQNDPDDVTIFIVIGLTADLGR